jgi:hypothetical protein
VYWRYANGSAQPRTTVLTVNGVEVSATPDGGPNYDRMMVGLLGS